MYEGVIAMEPVAKGETFSEVFRTWARKIQELIRAGEMSHQVLETACWIESNGTPFFFDSICNLARKQGLIGPKGEIL